MKSWRQWFDGRFVGPVIDLRSMLLKALAVRLLRLLLTTVVVSSVLLQFTGVVFAQDAREAALDEFDRGEAAYRAGSFEEAVEHLQRAYELYEEPIILFNLGRAHEALHQYEEAARVYSDYLAAAPNAPDRAQVERRIALARESMRAEQTSEDQTLDPVPWVLAGGGLVVAAVSAVLIAYALELHDRAVQAPDHRAALSLQSDAEAMMLGADIGLVVGAVALALGVTWGLVVARSDAASSGGGPSSVSFRGSSVRIAF